MNEFKNEKEKGKNVYKILFIAVFILLIVLIGYLTFTRVLDSKKLFGKEDNQQTQENQQNKETDVKFLEKELDIESTLVSSLFKSVNVPDSIALSWKNINNNSIVTVNDLSYEDKFLITLANTNTDFSRCDDEIKNKILNSFATGGVSYGCGIFANSVFYEPETQKWQDDVDAWSLVYKEFDIKTNMNALFGKNTYERKEIIAGASQDYLYIDSLNGYIPVDVPKGGIKPEINEKLSSAIKYNDKIVINVTATYKGISEEDTYYNFKYTFNYDKDDESYYFYSLEKTKK